VSRGPLLRALFLGLLVVASALAVVDAEYRSRALFVELEQLRKERDRLDLEWRNLRLEMSTWANQGRVEQLARERLGMRSPAPLDVVVIYP
jgi:cell division protein FtsL